MKIFGVRIDCDTQKVVRDNVRMFLLSDATHHVATVNAEFLLEAQKNIEFHNVLTATDLNVPDSIGLHLAFWKQGLQMKARYPGIDLMRDILFMAQENESSIYLLTNAAGLSLWEETAQSIKDDFPLLDISGSDVQMDHVSTASVVASMGSANIIFCNFGAPEQDIFLHSLKDAIIPSVRLLMGVGGSYDFITGKQVRAPHWMRSIGLEWLYRLWKQPRRFKRIINAVIIFPLKILFTKN